LPRLERYIDLLIQELVERDCTGGCPLISLMVEAGKTNESVRMRLPSFFSSKPMSSQNSLKREKAREKSALISRLMYSLL
jgi:TetR/AcrR family transcriptional regulator, transcriptional repressor for nem operon